MSNNGQLPDIHQIRIRSYEERTASGGGKPYIAYRLEVFTATKIWPLDRRYSDFDALHRSLLRRFPDIPVPASLPPKTYSLFGTKDGDIERRREGLEAYVTAILQAPDDTWRQSVEFRNFLGQTSVSSLSQAQSTSASQASSNASTPRVRRRNKASSAEGWMDDYHELETVIQEVETLIAYRNRMEHTQSDEAKDTTMQAKRLIANLSYRLKQLTDSLSQTIHLLTDGEVLRRQDLLETLRHERDRCLRSLSLASSSDRSALFGSSLPSSSSKQGGRVFGKPQETPETLALDNPALLTYQQSLISTQDTHLSTLSSIIGRQKELGRAMGDELEVQNQLLENLDQRVERTAERVKGTTRKMEKFT